MDRESPGRTGPPPSRSEEHTSELKSRLHLVCRLLLEKKKMQHHCDDQPHAIEALRLQATANGRSVRDDASERARFDDLHVAVICVAARAHVTHRSHLG